MTFGCASRLQAANWLTLVGTEPPEQTCQFWAVIQPLYTIDYGDQLKGLQGSATALNGEYVVKNTIGPWNEEQEKFQIQRLRAGVRGRFYGRLSNVFTEQINYFLLVETAPSLLTYEPFGSRDRNLALSDLSLTFSHIPGARIQVGLFKNPGPEEIFQPMGLTSDFIEVTDFIGRVYLERFSSGSTRRRGYGGVVDEIGTPVTTAYGFSAARDWGIQFFDSFRFGKWDLSYAIKGGRGEGIHESRDHDHNRELYLYSSLEYDLPGGQGPWKNGIKMFTWYQSGERRFDSDPDEHDYKRLRWGLGCKGRGRFLGCLQRLGVELMYANGMIFTAPTGNVKGGFLQYAAQKGNKTRGLSLDYGFYLQKWQFDLRYHRHDILHETDDSIWISTDQRRITETTLGLTYHFTSSLRLRCNYIFRDAKAPGNDDEGTQLRMKSVKNRLALQLSWIIR